MLEEQAYDRIDAADDDAAADAPPAVGPGGLQNVSQTSAWAASGRASAPPPPRAWPRRAPRRAPPPPRTPPKIRLENKVRQSLRQATHDLRPGRASKDERRRVALAVVALHVFLARKLGACTPIVVVGGAASAVFALRHHDDDAALRNARSYARRFLSYALAAALSFLKNSRTYYAQLERVVPPQVLRGVAGAWAWRVAQFLWSAEACATSLRHAAVAGAALACYAAASARTAPSLAVAVGILHCALALVARLGGADAVAVAVAGLAWARPDVGPGRPARDFGVARVAAGPARGGVADRSEVYLGACLVWMSGRDLSVERRPPD